MFGNSVAVVNPAWKLETYSSYHKGRAGKLQLKKKKQLKKISPCLSVMCQHKFLKLSQANYLLSCPQSESLQNYPPVPLNATYFCVVYNKLSRLVCDKHKTYLEWNCPNSLRPIQQMPENIKHDCFSSFRAGLYLLVMHTHKGFGVSFRTLSPCPVLWSLLLSPVDLHILLALIN